MWEKESYPYRWKEDDECYVFIDHLPHQARGALMEALGQFIAREEK